MARRTIAINGRAAYFLLLRIWLHRAYRARLCIGTSVDCRDCLRCRRSRTLWSDGAAIFPCLGCHCGSCRRACHHDQLPCSFSCCSRLGMGLFRCSKLEAPPLDSINSRHSIRYDDDYFLVLFRCSERFPHRTVRAVFALLDAGPFGTVQYGQSFWWASTIRRRSGPYGSRGLVGRVASGGRGRGSISVASAGANTVALAVRGIGSFRRLGRAWDRVRQLASRAAVRSLRCALRGHADRFGGDGLGKAGTGGNGRSPRPCIDGPIRRDARDAIAFGDATTIPVGYSGCVAVPGRQQRTVGAFRKRRCGHHWQRCTRDISSTERVNDEQHQCSVCPASRICLQKGSNVRSVGPGWQGTNKCRLRRTPRPSLMV